MSVFLEHGNSEHIQDGTYQSYYRFHLHRNDDYQQHGLLKDLADTLAPTYYVAPEISNANLFGVAYQNGTVSANSRLIPLLECPVIATGDNEPHYITYAPGNTDFIFHSEPQLRHFSIAGSQIETLYQRLLGQRRELSAEYVGSLLEQAEALLTRLGTAQPKTIAKPTAKHRIGQLAQYMAANYGLATVILAER